MGKTITIAGFKGGVGKSTLSNFLAEKLGNSTVINLDNYQDAEDFNTSKTVNAGSADLSALIKSQISDFCIIDAGGFDDARLYSIDIDLLILPTRTDYRSIKTTVDSAITILQKKPGMPVLFVINMYQTDKELDTAVEILEDILMVSEAEINGLYVFAIKHSGAVTTATNKKMSLAELLESNGQAYKSINKQFDEFADEVRGILEEEAE